jgi:hypothetical protein
LFLSQSLSALEEGVLKIDQRVVSSIIIEYSPEAITVDYLKRNLKAYEEDGALKKVWAVDLRGTYMSSEDFQSFMEMVNRKTFPILRVLVLGTVSLEEKDWDRVLLGFLSWDSLKTMDVCRTLYSNREIRSVLQKIHSIYGSSSLSHKLIFADHSYYRRLSATIQWPRDCIGEGILGSDWMTYHQQYYQGDHKLIERAAPLHFLTGDSDTDKQMLEYTGLDDITPERRSSASDSHVEVVEP